MYPRRSAQEVLSCDLCENAPLQSHCELCDINLCCNCVEKHISDTSKRHNVVPYTPNSPKRPKHGEKQCELNADKCNLPTPSTCISSGKHKGHNASDIMETLSSKTQSVQDDLEELEIRLYPRYKEMASDVQTEKGELETNYGKLITAADQQGEILHQEVTAIVNQRKSNIKKMKSKHLATLDRNTDEITEKIKELQHIMADLKSMLRSNDVSLTSAYKSRNSEFRTLPPKVRVTLPSFSPQKINKNQLNEMVGSMSSVSLTKEHGGTMKSPEALSSPSIKPMKSPEAVSSPPVKPMKSPEAVSSPSIKPMKSPEAVSSPPVKPMKSPEAVSSPSIKPMKSPEAVSSPPVKPMKSPEAVSPLVKPLLGEPRFTATINSKYGVLYNVRCLSDEQIWTSGANNIMRLLNLQGRLLTTTHTKSWNMPEDITVTQDGDLVYTDPDNRTIDLVNNEQIRTVITLQGWVPRNICSTAANDLLVTMNSNDKKQSKVVRYSGSTETQTIQFDDQGRPLYSSGYLSKYISENRNMDICVADWTAKAVVVVNQSGKFRFRYTGHPSNTEESFSPVGITTNSQGHILTADPNNHRIHVLDQDGQILRYIHGVRQPYGLCVDNRDNLFVADEDTARVKKIQYLSTQC